MKKRTKNVMGLCLVALVGVATIIPLASCYGPPPSADMVYTDLDEKIINTSLTIELDRDLPKDVTYIRIYQEKDKYLDLKGIDYVIDTNLGVSFFFENKTAIDCCYIIDEGFKCELGYNDGARIKVSCEYIDDILVIKVSDLEK